MEAAVRRMHRMTDWGPTNLSRIAHIKRIERLRSQVRDDALRRQRFRLFPKFAAKCIVGRLHCRLPPNCGRMTAKTEVIDPRIDVENRPYHRQSALGPAKGRMCALGAPCTKDPLPGPICDLTPSCASVSSGSARRCRKSGRYGASAGTVLAANFLFNAFDV